MALGYEFSADFEGFNAPVVIVNRAATVDVTIIAGKDVAPDSHDRVGARNFSAELESGLAPIGVEETEGSFAGRSVGGIVNSPSVAPDRPLG